MASSLGNSFSITFSTKSMVSVLGFSVFNSVLTSTVLSGVESISMVSSAMEKNIDVNTVFEYEADYNIIQQVFCEYQWYGGI